MSTSPQPLPDPSLSSSFDALLHSLRTDDDIRTSHHHQHHQHSLLIQQQLTALHSLYTDISLRNASLTQDWHTLAAVHQSLQAEYRTLKATKERGQLELEECRRAMEEERREAAESLRRERDRAEALLAQVHRLTASHRDREEEVSAYQQERESFIQQLQAVQSELGDSQREVQSLHSTLQEVEAQHAQSLNEAAELRVKVKSGEADLQAVRNAKFIAEKELQAHEGIAAMIQKLNEEARKALTIKHSHAPAQVNKPQPSTPATDAIQQQLKRKERRPLEELNVPIQQSRAQP